MSAPDDLRDHAALVALNAFLTNDFLRSAAIKMAEKDGTTNLVTISRTAFSIADAMCAARTKVEGES